LVFICCSWWRFKTCKQWWWVKTIT